MMDTEGKAMFGCAVFSLLIVLALYATFWGTIGYVVVHFIGKLW